MNRILEAIAEIESVDFASCDHFDDTPARLEALEQVAAVSRLWLERYARATKSTEWMYGDLAHTLHEECRLERKALRVALDHLDSLSRD